MSSSTGRRARHAVLGLTALALGWGLLAGPSDAATVVPPASDSSAVDAATPPTPSTTTVPVPEPSPETTAPSTGGPQANTGLEPPYGEKYPVVVETNFSRPKKSISSKANSDFSLLDDLERLIRGTYRDQNTGRTLPASARNANYVYMSISRMENSYRVGRELIKAAKAGVRVRVIHGQASQSKESRALQKALNSSKLRNSSFHICKKGKSLACLSSRNGAIMHSKLLVTGPTYDRTGQPAKASFWSGSANLGGPSGERTWNNGLTVYNDKKLQTQITRLWADMWAERNVGSNYLSYVKSRATTYAIPQETADRAGYIKRGAVNGMFYSNLANVTIYPTPIYATPTNGRDPVLNLLNRIIPDDQCRIRLQHNRFKYRRMAVALKLVELQDQGCRVSAVAFRDDLKSNRIANCQQWLRICKPIVDVLRTANRRIELSWAKPHDKTMLVEAKLKRNPLNTEERLPNGREWPAAGARAKVVQAGSAALTGSNLVVSDEITTETTDPEAYEAYLEHWKRIWQSYEHKDVSY